MKTDQLLVELLDTSLTGIYFFFGGILISHIVQNITITYSKIDHKELKEKDTLKVFLDICYEIALISIFAYILRKIVKNIPFLLDRYKGYKHCNLSALNGDVFISFAIIFYVNQDLDNKVQEFLKRFNINTDKK